MEEIKDLKTAVCCHHCGEACEDDQSSFEFNEKIFCCQGCLMVFQVLNENGLHSYYSLNQNPGRKVNEGSKSDYSFLDEEAIQNELIQFDDNGICSIDLKLPQIHCTSCLWLLENLFKLNEGIKSAKVNFVQRKARIVFEKSEISLRELVELLSSIGYAAEFTLESLENNNKKTNYDKRLLYKLGLAGFAFGNIMLLSFPEYLGFSNGSQLFYLGYINIILAIPVLFYCGWDYIKSAFLAIRFRELNLDVPIALGMIVLFGRSTYEILFNIGEGYLDSFTGFVFFLLIGRWFQSFTYEALDFDRNYASYFPISAMVKIQENWFSRSLKDIKEGDTLLIKNQELVPCDSIISKGRARVDYSFVTGESTLSTKNKGDKVLGGGRHSGSPIEVKVLKSVDQSYLTQLWKEKVFSNTKASYINRSIQKISTYFIYIILVIASISLFYWSIIDASRSFEIFTAVLIVACPCALALSIPFTYGNMIRLLSKKGLYLRNTETIEQIQDVNHIVFDKTGTLTNPKDIKVTYEGMALSEADKSLLKSACTLSFHPLSQAISKSFVDSPLLEIQDYKDFIGEGFTASSGNNRLIVGSSEFVFGTKMIDEKGVFVSLNGSYVGHFTFQHGLREGTKDLFQHFSDFFKIHILSGDNKSESDKYEYLVKEKKQLVFGQNPSEKLKFIKKAQEEGDCVMMVGDGLNDAGALKQADVGIVFTDEGTNFSPACDAIYIAKYTASFENLLKYIHQAKYIIYGAFTLAFLYNIIGLYFAVTGQLRPVVAAILMPVSSITVIIFGISMSYLLFLFTMRKK